MKENNLELCRVTISALQDMIPDEELAIQSHLFDAIDHLIKATKLIDSLECDGNAVHHDISRARRAILEASKRV